VAVSADVTRFFLSRFAKPESTGVIMIVHRSILILVVLATWVSPVMTQETGNQATTIAVISPIFSELVMYSIPVTVIICDQRSTVSPSRTASRT